MEESHFLVSVSSLPPPWRRSCKLIQGGGGPLVCLPSLYINVSEYQFWKDREDSSKTFCHLPHHLNILMEKGRDISCILSRKEKEDKGINNLICLVNKVNSKGRWSLEEKPTLY